MTLATAGTPRRASAVQLRPGDPHLVSLLAPGSFEAEQYRMLRLSIEKRHQQTDLRIVGVTSSDEGEGKTTTAINLAAALAHDREARVLLLDADLRRPAVAERLGMPRSAPGLVEALLDRYVAMADVVSVDSRYNLAVLPAGRSTKHPYEVLKSPEIGGFFQQLRHVFEYVIVDTAPVMSCPDPRLLEPWVDGFLLVVRAHKTPKGVVASALGQMDRSKMLGLVLNGDDDTGAYGRRYSGNAATHGARRSRAK